MQRLSEICHLLEKYADKVAIIDPANQVVEAWRDHEATVELRDYFSYRKEI